MALRDLVGIATDQLRQNKQDKRDKLITENFGDRPIRKILIFEVQNKVYTDTLYIYDDVDSIKYTASDYNVRSSNRNMRLYNAEAKVIGNVEEIARENAEGNKARLKLFRNGQLMAEMSGVSTNKGRKYELTNGCTIEGNSTMSEYTIFSGKKAVVQISNKNVYNVFHDIASAVYFYDDVDELSIILIVLALETMLLPEKNFDNDVEEDDIEDYEMKRKEITDRRKLRQNMFYNS